MSQIEVPSDPVELREEVRQYPTEEFDDLDWIRWFGAYLEEQVLERDAHPGAETLAVRSARDFRDLLGVNIMRILDRWGFQHPDGYVFRFDFSSRGESFYRRFDPVTDEERAPGGVVDFRPGDIIEVDNGWAIVIATSEAQLLALTPNGLGLYPLATIRSMFEGDEYETRVWDGDRVVRESGSEKA